MSNYDDKTQAELLALVASTAKGALASNERCKKAMTKALEAIGLLHSMNLSKELSGSKSEKIVLDAVGLLHEDLRFMSEVPQKESGGLSPHIPKGWAGTPEMAKNYLRENGFCSENNCDCRAGKSLDFYCGCKCHDAP